MKKYIFNTKNTHCSSCKMFIEETFNNQSGISDVFVDLKNETVTLNAEENDQIKLVNFLNEKIKSREYIISIDKIKDSKKDESIWYALPIGIFFLLTFFILQKSGILNFSIGGQVTSTTAFLIGVIASLSSCLAVVGGLVLSLSAKVTEDDNSNKKPLYLFHIGRLISFIVLGGLLGLIGKSIGISFLFSAILGLIASVVMISLGLNLIGVFKMVKFTIHPNIFNFFRKAEHQMFAPLLLGFGTFFLPCGFTQSMQVAALSSGSFISGMLIMFYFALGTLPMLSLLSFGSISFAKSKYAPLFFKTSGVIVIGLGLFSLLAGLAGLGFINPLFNI